MERMMVVVFDSETEAYEGVAALQQLEREGSISAYAGAVVAKNSDGTASVKQLDDVGPVGSLVGTSIGSLIGLLGGPVGLAIGAMSGLSLGALVDIDNAGVGADFVEDVLKSLQPTKVAVVADVEEEWTTPVDTRMEALGGTVLRRAVSEVRETLRQQHVAAMKADLAQLKAELAKARADHRKKLQHKIEQLQARIDSEQKKVAAQQEAFREHQKAKREIFKRNAAAAGRALKQLANTQL
jgi:uncharacterized membrane protein